MQVNYWRIAIYVLTFFTYAYSGYGSNIIHNLRDAIIAAEAVFGDVFKNVIHVARKFQTVHQIFDAAVEENCVFKCPGGVTPQRNKFYQPSADGCGSLGMKINTEYLPAIEMENCCNAHDICYDTCNKDKELCDLDFKRCLYNYCETHEQMAVGSLVAKGCKAAAKMLFTGTLTLGCRSYLDSQERACYCAAPSDGGPKSTSSERGGYQKRKQKYSGGDANGNSHNANHNSRQKEPSAYGWKDPNEM